MVPEAIVQPTIFLVLLGCVYTFPGFPRTGPAAVGLNAVAVIGAFLAGVILLRRSMPISEAAPIESHRSRQWLRTALPLAWVLGMNVVVTHTDVVMLGIMDDTDSAGTYRVAAQIAALAALPLAPSMQY